MKRNKIYLAAATFLMLTFLSTSCTNDFEKINTNNNALSLEKAAPDMLLTNAIESMTSRVHEIFLGHEMGSCWVQHMAKVQYTDEDRYIPRMSVINNTWTSFYASSGMDINLIYQLGVDTNNPSYQGVALILKSYVASVLTDEFGAVPYTEAWLGSSSETPIVSPKYDTQESIYVALLANLEQANTLLDEGSEIGGDILFDGDLMKWKKFANSLRLRLLLRRSDRVDPTADMTAMVSNPAMYPIFESNNDDAELHYLASAPNNNPINENRKTRDDHRVSKTLVDKMWNSGAAEPDYRIMAYAKTEATGDFVGMPNGMLSADAVGYLGNGLANTSKLGDYFTAATAPGVLMSYSELQFILAEAAHRNFISGGEAAAETFYVEGISSSYYKYTSEIEAGVVSLYGTSPGDYVVDDMLEWFLADGGYVYNTANATKQIATQKWVAMFGQGLQAAFEWRRTGYPVLIPAIDGANGGKIPVRAYYPSDEAARNNANLSAAVTAQGADNLNTRVWWDAADNY